MPPSLEKVKQITKAIAVFIAKDWRPYSVMENQGFRALLHTLEPRYTIPSQRYFTNTAMPTLYNQTKTDVMASLLRVGDAWTSVATKSFVTLNAHHITDNWKLKSHVLQTRVMNERHTGANVAELLNLPLHKLKIDCSTNWNSAYDMVSRFLEQQPAIIGTLLSPLVRQSESDLYTLTEADVTNAEDFIAALKPMKDATSVMSEEVTSLFLWLLLCKLNYLIRQRTVLGLAGCLH